MDSTHATHENYQEKLAMYEQAIKEADFSAFHEIAWIYDELLKDEQQAKVYYELSIEFENKNTQVSKYNLAHVLQEKDKDKAIQLFEEIKDQDIDAIFMLGKMHMYRNPTKAIEYFELGMKQSSPSCIHGLGRVYEYEAHKQSTDETKNEYYTKAFKNYEKAAGLGHSGAIDALARFYRVGRGVSINIDNEYETLNNADYEILTRYGKYNLAWFYFNTVKYQNYKRAFEIFQELDEKYQDNDAQYMIGMHYLNGKAVEKDTQKAIIYFKKSANNGCADSYKKLFYLAKTEKCISTEEQMQHFKSWMKARMNSWKPPDVEVKVSSVMLDQIMSNYFKMEKRLLEYELQPPCKNGGGELFQKAKERFDTHTKAI